MKGLLKRILAVTMVLCMVITLMPTNISASTKVTPSPNTGNSDVNSLEVEYFSSTLYNWDESAANAATAEADVSTGYTSTTVAYSTVASSNNSSYTSTSYYYLVDGAYYPVYYTRSDSGGGPSRTTTYTLYYLNGSTYTQIGSTTNGNDTVTLYTSGGYEGKGFYFTGSDNKGDNVPSFSSWSGSEQNYMIYSGLAASKLSESSNAPFNDDVVNAANLFATDGSNEAYTSVYTNVQVPFVYDSETGYYTLDSDTYGVYFSDPNNIDEDGEVMSIADLPMGYYAYAGSYFYKCGFAPFNTPNGNSVMTSYYETATGDKVDGYSLNESMVYGFGMVTTVDFRMTDDGLLNGEPIEFTFSGDDDVWVYIDGILVLDIGGTHDAITGTIDFSTGDVTLDAANYEMIGDKATGDTYNDTMSQANLYEALGTTLTGFASEGEHTMTIYYMDRGQGRTNCLISFNLPQEDSLSVTKEIADTYSNVEGEDEDASIDEDILANLKNIDFSFTLYTTDEDGNLIAVDNESYSLYDEDGNFVQTGSTDSSGNFTLKGGYTATFNNIDLNDEGTTYKVVENLSSSRWTTSVSYTAYINSKTTNVIATGTESSVTVSDVTGVGTDTSADYINWVFTNQYSKGGDPDVDVYDETIVLDYGLPVEVDVTANDVMTLYGKAISGDYSPKVSLSLVESTSEDEKGNVTAATTEKYEGTYGYAEIQDGKIVYTLTSDFCGIETVQYEYSVEVTLENAEGDTYSETGSAIGTLTIIPATSVYYEENFGTDDDPMVTTKANGTVESVIDSENEYGTYQETGLVGTTDDSTYGTDEVYLENLGDSQGTSLMADTTNGAVQYQYSFTGCGTTIYGRVSSDTGYIRVKVTHSVTYYVYDEEGNVVYDETTNEPKTEIKEETVETQYIDTIELTSASVLTSDLYNIPIYQNTALESGYDTYTVYIYVYKAGTITSQGTSGSKFYLDGIRVFQPMGTSTEDNDGYDTAASAYATDGEANMAVINIHDQIVAEAEGGYAAGDSVFTLTDIDGTIMTVVSSSSDSEDADEEDTETEDAEETNTYDDIGPNQEFYLKGEGYTITFALENWSASSYKIYLGLKAPEGKESSVTFSSYVIDEDTDTSSELGTIEVKNSADCYYDISSYVDVKSVDGVSVGFVTITSSSENLVALTNIKITGTYGFVLGYASDIETDNEDDDEETAAIYLVSSTYAASLLTEEEEAVFEPNSITVSSSYASKTKKATVTVVTSSDVAYVTINGTKVTGTKTAGGKLKFSKSFTKVTKGTTYEVIAYDSDGVASESYTVTAK